MQDNIELNKVIKNGNKIEIHFKEKTNYSYQPEKKQKINLNEKFEKNKKDEINILNSIL